MSSTFSFSRLGKLIKKQFYENSRLYGFSILALFGLLSIIFAFWIGTDEPDYREEGTLVMFVMGLYTAGTVFTSFSFNMLGSRDKGVYWLGIPATHAEKLVCTILYSTVLFFVAYCLCFYIVKSVAISYLQGYIKTHPGYSFNEMKNFEHGFAKVFKYFVYAYFAVQSVYLLGSVYFNRYSFVITSVVGVVILFALVYYLSTIEDHMFKPLQWDLVSAKNSDPSLKEGNMVYEIPPAVAEVFWFVLKFALAPLFWVITWFRLKEKEI